MNRTRSLIFTFISAIIFLAVSLSVSSQSLQRAEIEKRVNELLARMTLEEKLGQLQQLDGQGTGAFRPEHLELARKGLLGSTLNVRGVEQANRLQKVAVEESRLKIPILFGSM